MIEMEDSKKARILELTEKRKNSPMMQKVRNIIESEKGSKETFFFNPTAFDNFMTMSLLSDILEATGVIEEISPTDEGWATGELTFTRR